MPMINAIRSCGKSGEVDCIFQRTALPSYHKWCTYPHQLGSIGSRSGQQERDEEPDIIRSIYFIIAPTGIHLHDFRETFDNRETLDKSPGSFAPYLIIVVSWFKYWHNHMSKWKWRQLSTIQTNHCITLQYNLTTIELTVWPCVWQPTARTADVTVTKIAGYVRVRILMNRFPPVFFAFIVCPLQPLCVEYMNIHAMNWCSWWWLWGRIGLCNHYMASQLK